MLLGKSVIKPPKRIMTTGNKHLASQNFLTCAIIAITFIGAIAWDLCCPIISDDWAYSQVCPENDRLAFWDAVGRDIENYSDVFESFNNHYGLVNGRLSNLCHMMFVPLGKTTESVIGGIMIGLLSLLIASGIYRKWHIGYWNILLATLLMWIALPWYDGMESFAYQANYVWTSALAILLLMSLRRIAPMSIWMYILVTLLALITGAMHEGFTLPLLTYLFFYIILSPKADRVRLIGLFALLLLGLAFNLYGGTVARIENEGLAFKFCKLWSAKTAIISQYWVLLITLILFAIKIFRHKHDRKRIFIKYLPLLSAILVSACIPMVLVLFERVLWPLNLFCILLILNLVVPWFEKNGSRYIIVSGVAFCITYTLWLFELCKWEKRMLDEMNVTINYFGTRDVGRKEFPSILYADNIIDENNIPWYLMGIVKQPLQHLITNSFLASHFVGRTEHIVPVPKELFGKKFEEWPKIPGDNDFRGTWPFIAQRDSIVAPIQLTFGAPMSNMTPIDRFLSMLRFGLGAECYTIGGDLWPRKAMMPDSSTIYLLYVAPMPRTIEHRRFIRADKVIE